MGAPLFIQEMPAVFTGKTRWLSRFCPSNLKACNTSETPTESSRLTEHRRLLSPLLLSRETQNARFKHVDLQTGRRVDRGWEI